MRIAEVIRVHREEILRLWTAEAQRAASARGLGKPEFENLMPLYLDSLTEPDGSLEELRPRQRKYLENHVASRIRQGFSLPEIVEELALLGRSIYRAAERCPVAEQPTTAELEKLFVILHLSSVAVVDRFTRHMLENEQIEKRYLRLIQSVATEAIQDRAAPLRERLGEILGLIMDALAAQSAAVQIFNAETGKLDVAASAGVGAEELGRVARSLSTGMFAGYVAAQAKSSMRREATTSTVEVPDALRKSGVGSLFSMQLPPHHRRMGVLYVGFSEVRSFAPGEAARLETFGQQLMLHLDNAALYADLRKQIATLNEERDLRDLFVSVLAHDLRGPLSSAKMAAQMLFGRPRLLDEERDLAVKVSRNVDRAERMIRDLLDTNRIRAGGSLPLRIGPCELTSVARNVVAELASAYGERFVVDAGGEVRGFWSHDEIERALWNLATNAVKYGTSDALIRVRVAWNARGEALLEVHNEGNPLSPEDQKLLFVPFSRTRAAQQGAQLGWGLGLALVEACAKAHGGRTEVESSPVSGTTFKLVLPKDSRPFHRAQAVEAQGVVH